MTLAVPIDQAAIAALASYLRTRFTALGVAYQTPKLEVFAGWPEMSRRLPELAVTVITAGPWDQGDWWSPEIIQTTIVDAATSTYVWEVTDLEQPMQIDLWARTDADRGDLLKNVIDFLHAGTGVTLGTGTDPTRPGLLLAVGSGWLGNADLYFDAPDTSETEDSSGQSEYRATIKGSALLSLQLTSTVYRMKSIQLKAKLHEGAVAPAGALYDITTITASGVTHTKGT